VWRLAEVAGEEGRAISAIRSRGIIADDEEDSAEVLKDRIAAT
jgi:hypothetical protein